jgi:histidinol-phosphatase (PHP family)
MVSQYLFDYHLHTSVTIDGRMSEMDACERAVSLGIQEIAFTNHIMLAQPDYTISPQAFVDHWKVIQDCQAHYPQLVIRLGLEMDYYLDREKEITATLSDYEDLIGRPFDLVLGSVHELNGSFFSSKHVAPAFFKGSDLLGLYHAYFQVVTRAAQSGLFDIMAHPDLIKKYTHELTPPIPFEVYRCSVEPFIDTMIDHGVGLEVNTKGLKLSVREIYPSLDFLKLYLAKAREHGVDPTITLGSDAHRAEEVGHQIPETTQMLGVLGLSYLTRFDQRQRSQVSIT